eukprot:4219258-Amphidinium_carterae.1
MASGALPYQAWQHVLLRKVRRSAICPSQRAELLLQTLQIPRQSVRGREAGAWDAGMGSAMAASA